MLLLVALTESWLVMLVDGSSILRLIFVALVMVMVMHASVLLLLFYVWHDHGLMILGQRYCSCSWFLRLQMILMVIMI